jgi:hypothetical protein
MIVYLPNNLNKFGILFNGIDKYHFMQYNKSETGCTSKKLLLYYKGL